MMIIDVSCEKINHLLVDSLDDAGALVGLGHRLLCVGTCFRRSEGRRMCCWLCANWLLIVIHDRKAINDASDFGERRGVGMAEGPSR